MSVPRLHLITIGWYPRSLFKEPPHANSLPVVSHPGPLWTPPRVSLKRSSDTTLLGKVLGAFLWSSTRKAQGTKINAVPLIVCNERSLRLSMQILRMMQDCASTFEEPASSTGVPGFTWQPSVRSTLAPTSDHFAKLWPGP